MSTSPDPLFKIVTSALEDVKSYLQVIDPALYAQPLEILSSSTIGQHTRHIIEFYSCLIDQGTKENGVINYSARRRDYLIESRPDHANHTLTMLFKKLSGLDLLKTCLLDCSEHGQEGLVVQSTIGRELIYNIEHTVHHLAIIKIALKAVFPEFTFPQHFGVAPSTLRHRLEACAQ